MPEGNGSSIYIGSICHFHFFICAGICGEYSYSGKRTDGHYCGKESCDDFFLHNFFSPLEKFSLFFIFLYKMNCPSYDFAVSFCNIFPLQQDAAGCCLLRYQPLTAPENIPLISCFCPMIKIEMDGMMIMTTPAIIRVMDWESTLSSILIPI